MLVSEAVASRRSIRDFASTPVDLAIIRRVLEMARFSPSGGNLQPWNAHVVGGDALTRLLASISPLVEAGRAGHTPEYTIYPRELEGRYEHHRFAVGEEMYRALGIPRNDKAARLQQFKRNYQAFGAPILMIVHTPRYMGPPQWADLGMWLQTIMLLLREAGLDSCCQEAWAIYHRVIRDSLQIDPGHTIFCGMSIGYSNPEAAINKFPVARVELEECVTFLTE